MHFLALSVHQIFNSRNLIPDFKKNSHSTKSKLSVENLKAEIHSVFSSRSTFEIQDKSLLFALFGRIDILGFCRECIPRET